MVDRESGKIVDVWADYEALKVIEESFKTVNDMIEEKKSIERLKEKENEELKFLKEEVRNIEEKIKEEEYKRGLRREGKFIEDGMGVEELINLREMDLKKI